MNEGRKPVIKTRQEFEEHVLELNRKDWKADWKADPQKFKDEIKAIRRAYYQGADDDVEKKVRLQQIYKLNLTANHPAQFFCDEKFMKRRLAEAEKITAETLKQKQQEIEEVEKLKQPPTPSKPKTQLQKLMARIDAGDLLAEKGLEFSLLRSAQRFEKEEIKMSYKAWWIGDCIVRAIVGEQGLVLTEEERKSFNWNMEDLRKAEEYLADLALRDPKDHAALVPHITLTDFCFRELLQKKISNAEIYSLVEEFMGATVTRETSKFTEDGDRWVSYFEMDKICKVKGLKTGKYSARNKLPEHAYKFIFDRASSIHFWNNVRLGLFSCRPLSFRNLRGGSQLVYRAIGCLSKYSFDLELDELCWIAKVKTKHKTRRQEIIEGFLNELKEAAYVSNWKKRLKKIEGKKEKQAWYRIVKTKSLPTK